jgi:hypothetical protein
LLPVVAGSGSGSSGARGSVGVVVFSLLFIGPYLFFYPYIFVQRNICCMYVHRGAPAEIKSSQLQLVLCLFSVALFWSDATDCQPVRDLDGFDVYQCDIVCASHLRQISDSIISIQLTLPSRHFPTDLPKQASATW